MVQISSRPIYVFRELLAYLTRPRLISPAYTVMQDMIGDVLQREKERLIAIVQSHLPEDAVSALNDLLANPHGLYEITRVKREPKDFSRKEINEEIQRGEQIKPLYDVAQIVLPRLKISNESIKYYASLINYYSVFPSSRLNPFSPQKSPLYRLPMLLISNFMISLIPYSLEWRLVQSSRLNQSKKCRLLDDLHSIWTQSHP